MEQNQTRVVFDDLTVTPLGDHRYRLEETPLGWEGPTMWRGDTIEAEALEDGTLRYLVTVERTSWLHHTWVLAREVVASDALSAFTDTVESEGGVWERAFGGLLIVHLPEGSTFDPEAAWAAALQSAL
jgi:hypothetical protein